MTPEQREVIAHIVIDPDAWFARVVATFGTAQANVLLEAKVARWQSNYAAAKTAEGGSYKSRAVRQAEDDAANSARLAARVAARNTRDRGFQTRIDAATTIAEIKAILTDLVRG